MQMELSSLYSQDLYGVCVLLRSRVNHSAPAANKVFPHCRSVRIGAGGEEEGG